MPPWHAICSDVAMQFVGDIRRLLQRSRIDAQAAARLWGAILDAALDDIEVGAVLGALGAAGATGEELIGLQQAAQGRLGRAGLPPGPRAVPIPAYGVVLGEAPLLALCGPVPSR